MTESELFEILNVSLAKSRSTDRKSWAAIVIDNDLELAELLPLLHRKDITSQRFMWLLGDICELEPQRLEPCLPLLFSLRSEMPFPGMPRSVAKWLMLTKVPANIEEPAIAQLFDWLDDPKTSIGCQFYSAKTLIDLAEGGRADRERLRILLLERSQCSNPVHTKRMVNLASQL